MIVPKHPMKTSLGLSSNKSKIGNGFLFLAAATLSGCVHADYLVVNDDRASQFCSRDAETGATVCYEDFRRCERAREDSDDVTACVSREALAYGAMSSEEW